MNDYLNLQKTINLNWLKKSYKTEIESNYNKYVEASATIQYQVQKNKDKFNSIMDYINYLEKELKEQQEIFELSEVLSGKIVKIDA